MPKNLTPDNIQAYLEPLHLRIDVTRKQTKTKRYLARLVPLRHQSPLFLAKAQRAGDKLFGQFFDIFARTGRTSRQAHEKLLGLLADDLEAVGHTVELYYLAGGADLRNEQNSGSWSYTRAADLYGP